MKEYTDNPTTWSKNVSNERNGNAYGFDFKEMTNDELLQYYIAARLPVFLHGPSGVGKSTRVKQIDPENEELVLRNQMDLSLIDGDINPKTGEREEPKWHKKIVEKCKKEPDKIHILFIDELTNVKPATQSPLFDIIWDENGNKGLWPLPENCTIVAAGNETANNYAAYPLTNALFRRFSHIYFEVNASDWLDWALSVDGPVSLPNISLSKIKSKIHPAIVAFIKVYRERVLYQDLDEDNPKIVPDPRKWEMASKILYLTNNPYSMKPAIGDETAELFIDFVKSAQLTVQDVINHTYKQSDINNMKNNVAKKFSTTAALSNATHKELPVVRNFIKNNFEKEELKLFDLLWVQGNKDRALYLGQLMNESNQKELTF